MPERSDVVSGRRYAEDMRRIREARGISVDQLHEETKIPRDLIVSFEESGLFNHPMFNKVYLRSFVRTYAQVVGIDPDVAMAALEDALGAAYEGSMAVQFLDAPVSGGTPPQTPAVSVPDAGDEADEDTPAPPAMTVVPAATAAPVSSDRAGGPEWSAVSPPPGAARTRRTPKRRPERRRSGAGPFALVAIALLAIGALAAGYYFFLRDDGGAGVADVPVDARPAADTTAAPAATARTTPSLGPVMGFTVLAEGGPVRGLRVTRDADVRRPYWIEQGEARVFQARDRILFEDNLNNVRVLLEGYPYPLDVRDEQGRVVVTRAAAQQFLDTVDADPVPVPAVADTLPPPAAP